MTRGVGGVVALIAVISGCSSSTASGATAHEGSDAGQGSGSGGLAGDTATGSVGGAMLTIQGATALVGQTTALLDTTTNVALVGLTSASGATCSTLDGGQAPSTSGLTLLIVSKTAIEPGSYDVAPSSGRAPTLPAASAIFSKTNATCASIYDGGSPEATGGSVTISEISSGAVGGTYRVTFADGSLTGSFSAPVCPGVDLNQLLSGSADASAPACVPP